MKHTLLRALCLLCAVMLLGTCALTGCGSEAQEPATEADPHAGHNHGTSAPADDHNHDASAPADDHDATTADGTHNHKEPAAMSLAYVEEKGGTFALVIKDCQGNELLNKKGLTQKAISTEITTGVIELAWVTSNNPGGYECLYINRLTCQVSDLFVGEQATDGTRIVYSEIKDGKLSVTVRDLFDNQGYRKTTTLEDAYTAGAYTVLGTVKYGKDQVNVSYLTDKDGAHRIVAFDLYEKEEQSDKK